MEKNVNVLVEKPMAVTIEEADAMIKCANDNNVKLSVGHIERFNPAVRKLKEILGNEKILKIETCRYGPFTQRVEDVDVVLDLMTHDIDVGRYLINSEPVTINAMGGKIKPTSEGQDFAIGMIAFENDITALFSVSRVTQKKIRDLKVTCENKFIELDYSDQLINIYRDPLPEYTIKEKELVYKHENIIEKVDIPKKEPLKVELQHFVDCVRSNKESEVNGLEGRKNLEIALKVVNEMKNTRC
jgi:predicted dehydrogenase